MCLEEEQRGGPEPLRVAQESVCGSGYKPKPRAEQSSYEQAKGRVLFTLGKPEHPLTLLIQPRSRENNLKL